MSPQAKKYIADVRAAAIREERERIWKAVDDTENLHYECEEGDCMSAIARIFEALEPNEA